MADNENTPPNSEGNNMRVDIATLIYEIRVLFETVVAALDSLKIQPAAKPVTEQLSIIQKLAFQAGEALETLDETIQDAFKLRPTM
jgi:hypothetical protein